MYLPGEPPPNLVLAVIIVMALGALGGVSYEYGFWQALVYVVIVIGVFLGGLAMASAFALLVWGIKRGLDKITPWGDS